MAIERKDRVKDQTNTTGTGTITVDLIAPSGYRTMATHTTGATVNYLIIDATGTNWEVGQGVWTSVSQTLTRVTVFASSNAGALVSFGSGLKTVATIPTAADINQAPGTLINKQIFTASGTYTPTAGTNSIIVEVQAPGGGSGGTSTYTATSGTFYGLAEGGGGGGWGRKRITSGFAGAVITIGAPGTAGAVGGAGGNGGTTSFGSFLSCTGGGGGRGDTVNTFSSSGHPYVSGTLSAAGGVATGADVSLQGDGGIAAYPSTNVNLSVVGLGGRSMYAPITPGPSLNDTAGVAGVNYGGGASGACFVSTSFGTGGLVGAVGGSAIIIVWEYA